MKLLTFVASLFIVSLFFVAQLIFWPPDAPNTVMGISHSLACPCECPMVLEDCHMSCGLDWKDNIGNKLKAKMDKAEIEAYFFKKYGREAMLTPFERIAGKWYQVSRGGHKGKDFVLLPALILVWSGVVYYILGGLIGFFFKR